MTHENTATTMHPFSLEQLGELEPGLLLLIGIVTIFLIIALLYALIRFINDFSDELDYLTMEINRSTGEERKYWVRCRRRLWLSLIPFVRY